MILNELEEIFESRQSETIIPRLFAPETFLNLLSKEYDSIEVITGCFVWKLGLVKAVIDLLQQLVYLSYMVFLHLVWVLVFLFFSTWWLSL